MNFLIVIATFTGFYLGYPGDLHNFPVERMLNVLFGTLLVASGTGTLNQYLEHRFDAQMRRTSRRPIAAGRLRPRAAAWFGISLSIVGSVYLLATVNALSSALAVFTATSYLFIYTPLKRKTPLCTLAGAVPGAMPPLIGWAAASGSVVSAKAWMLYARAVPLAISSLHGNRLDVPGRLRAGWVLGSSTGRAERALHVLAGLAGIACSDSSQLDPGHDRSRRVPSILFWPVYSAHCFSITAPAWLFKDPCLRRVDCCWPQSSICHWRSVC